MEKSWVKNYYRLSEFTEIEYFSDLKEHDKLKNSPNENGLIRETPQDEYL